MPYLTNQEYIDRVGEAETIRVTDESRQGVIDTTKLSDAIKDASEFADSYIQTRYTLPLSTAPEILKSIITALAREYLHRQRPTQAVTDQANLARSQLKDIAAGRAALPVPVGSEPPQENASGLAVSSHDGRGRLFTDAALADYSGFGGGFGCRTPFNGPCG